MLKDEMWAFTIFISISIPQAEGVPTRCKAIGAQKRYSETCEVARNVDAESDRIVAGESGRGGAGERGERGLFWEGLARRREGARRGAGMKMSRGDEEEEEVPYVPSKMLAAGENHPTVAKALALKRFCWCGAIAFARGRKSYLLWVVARSVRVGLGVGGIDGRNMARRGRVVKRI